MIFGLKGKIPVQELSGCFYNGYLFGNDEASAEEPRKNQSKVKEIIGEEAFYQFSLLKKSVSCGYIAAFF